MQVFRFMGLPDKVLAFDSLPERLCQGFEWVRADGFPRHWKEWMGKRDRIIKIPPEKDFLTGGVRTFDPIKESDCYFFLVDAFLQPSLERWKEVSDWVRQHVSKDVRLMDKLEDMALPLAPDKTSSVTLEPEDVPVIPIPIEYQEKDAVPSVIEPANHTPQPKMVVCEEEGCKWERENDGYARSALRMHQKKHAKAKHALV
jgi:hypothetical protein